MADFDPMQIRIKQKGKKYELGFYYTEYELQNLSSYEISEVKVKWSYISSGGGTICNNGTFTYSPGFYNSKYEILRNVKPGDTQVITRQDNEKKTGYHLDSIEGVLADGRPFRREYQKPGGLNIIAFLGLCCTIGSVFSILFMIGANDISRNYSGNPTPSFFSNIILYGLVPLVIGLACLTWDYRDRIPFLQSISFLQTSENSNNKYLIAILLGIIIFCLIIAWLANIIFQMPSIF